MKNLDFISGSPTLSIFKEGANKTNAGGTIFLIYVIILLLLAAVYIYDYANKEAYEFAHHLVKGIGGTRVKELDKVIAVREMEREFEFLLGKDGDFLEESQSKNFIIIDVNKFNYIPGEYIDTTDNFEVFNFKDEGFIIKQNKTYQTKINNFDLAVLYKCEGTNCEIREEDKIKIDSYWLRFKYRGYDINYQSAGEPIQLLPKGELWYIDLQFLENTNIIYLFWDLIKYEEQKGMFGELFDKVRGKSNLYYGGDFDSKETYTDDGHIRNFPSNLWKIKDKEGNHFIVLLYLNNLYADQYDRYTRKKNSFLDVLADIAALSSTILGLISLAYGFLYANNFDNYKIIENILTKQLKVNINQKIELKGPEQNTELKTDLLGSSEENIDNKEKIAIDNNDGKLRENNKSSENIDLPSPNFFDFFFHMFYFKFFGPSNKHSLIDSCNDVVAKYITIERIIYNQMKLENLWKDYKWNNPAYEMKEKDDLLLDLKES